MSKSTLKSSAQEEERSAFQHLRFAETAKKYFHNPELAELYSSLARSHMKLAEALYSLAEASN